jgi:hypothetical protein
MSTIPATAHSSRSSNSSTLRYALIGTLYALVLLIRKLPQLRHNEHPWMLFRIFLGIAGASLVVVPLGLSNGYIFSIVGLAMFAAAILLPPARPETSREYKARELYALVVVNGGRFQLTRDSSVAVQMFVGVERIFVLDSRFNPLLVIAADEIISVSTVQLDGRWILRIARPDSTAAFSYRGIFAEHLARIAENAVRTVMRPSLPVIPQARAASA